MSSVIPTSRKKKVKEWVQNSIEIQQLKDQIKHLENKNQYLELEVKEEISKKGKGYLIVLDHIIKFSESSTITYSYKTLMHIAVSMLSRPKQQLFFKIQEEHQRHHHKVKLVCMRNYLT